MDEKLYFESIKERGNKLLAEYHPPSPSTPFAVLNLTYVEKKALSEVAADLESESLKWCSRYPIPLMANSFDKYGDLIELKEFNDSEYLVALKGDNGVELHWASAGDRKLSEIRLSNDELLKIYDGIKYRTSRELESEALKQVTQVRWLKVLFIVWAVVIPLLIAVLEFLSPAWIGVLALFYSFWKAFKQWRLMTGRARKTKSELAKEELNRRIAHHHHHCELNPEGFIRLRNENFKRESEERIRAKYGSAGRDAD